MNLSVAIISVSRTDCNYLHNTIASLMQDCPIPLNIFVGNRDTDYLNAYFGNSFIKFHTPTHEENESIKQKCLRVRAVWNYSRALQLEHDGDHLMIMEDDVELARGWKAFVEKAVVIAKETPLTLYAPDSSDTKSMKFTFPEEARQKGEIVAPYPTPKFYGTQAMVYTKSTQRELATFFKEKLENEDKRPIDWLVRDYALEKGCGILCTAPVIAQHTGILTTGLAGRDHQSDTYVSDVRKI
jgi:hypothetical protein